MDADNANNNKNKNNQKAVLLVIQSLTQVLEAKLKEKPASYFADLRTQNWPNPD